MQGPFDLTGKVVLVTGGSRGLGRAIALGVARAGADVVVSSRTLSACEEVAQEIRTLGRAALPLACDIACWDQIDRLVHGIDDAFGRCDVLVNNAGITHSPLPLAEITSEFFDQVHSINVKGPMHLASLLAAGMGKRGAGSIINVISVGGLRPVEYLGAYCSSKAALHALTRVMAGEWAPLGVRVNAIAPGTFVTDMIRELEQVTPGFIEHAAEQVLQKRAGDPEEIVGAVLFLASDASSYVTAQTISVCGGYL